MKQIITILFLATLVNSITHASDSKRYYGQDNSNNDCSVDVYHEKAGITIAINSDSGNYEFGYGSSLEWGTFSHCNDDFLIIKSEGSNIKLFCDEHNNEDTITKGHAEINTINRDLTSVSIKGYNKESSSAELKLDVNLVCKNLKLH